MEKALTENLGKLITVWVKGESPWEGRLMGVDDGIANIKTQDADLPGEREGTLFIRTSEILATHFYEE
jgi:hypothetical protein